jgi:hypothetical protein
MDFTLYDEVESATIGNDGSIAPGAWQDTTPLPVARSGLGTAALNGRIYVVAGYAKNGTLDDVLSAPIQSDGSLGPWVTSANHLNIPRSNHRVEIFKTPAGATYLAAIAGVGGVGADTVHFDSLEVAPIASDGSIGPWHLCPFHIKGGRSAPATLVNGGWLYVIGGWGDLLNDVFKDVQYAPIRDDGCVDPWHTSATLLNMPSYGHSYQRS